MANYPTRRQLGIYTRAYEHCRVALNCTNTSKEGCTASIRGPFR